MLLGGKNEKNIEPTTIIEGSAYALPSSNGGRKIVKLDSGKYVCVVIENNDRICIYRSYDKGVTWSFYISSYSASIITDISIATDGVFIYILYSYSKNNEGAIRLLVVNGNVFTGSTNFLIEKVKATSRCSLAISHDRLKICATWSCKTNNYPNCYNLRVRRGTISNGSISWNTVKQLTYETNSSNSMSQPTVIYDSSTPMIFFIAHISSIYNVRQYYLNGTNFYHKSNIGDVNTSYTKGYPCATFIPKSISTKINTSYTKGLIMVTWCAYDSVSNYYNIYCQASSDEGKTWIDWAKGGRDKLTYGDTYHQWLPTICWNNDGDIFIVWRNDKDGINHNISYIRWSISSGWSSVKTIRETYEQTWPNAIDNYHDFKKPIYVYQDSNLDEPSINFYGEH